MKFLILFLIILISPIELRRHDTDNNNDNDDDMYELSNLLSNKYDRSKHRPNEQYRVDDNDDDEPEYPSRHQHNKVNPSRKKVLDDTDYVNDESDGDDAATKSKSTISITTTTTVAATTTNQNDLSDTAVCINKYDIQPEQLVKVKELKNGARLIRYVLIDKRTLPFDIKVKDSCMLDCCAEPACDLAMLSEQPAHDGYKCYLFSCNGSCVLASHEDYTIMMPNKDPRVIKSDVISTTTTPNNDMPHKGSFFRETSVIIFLVFGVTCTIVLFILLFCHCRASRKRGRKFKNYSVDEDYLINGLYL